MCFARDPVTPVTAAMVTGLQVPQVPAMLSLD